MKHFLMISALVVAGCCFSGTLAAQTPCCKPNPLCELLCPSAAANYKSDGASVAVMHASNGGSKACSGQTAKTVSATPMACAKTSGTAANVNCDPTDCDWSKCKPSDCTPKNCDVSKCKPGSGASAGRKANAVRL
ncbi:MAG: hypothetical protein ACKVU2_04700 [Saprospiraceae bacterium]